MERLLDARFADARFAATREDLTPLLEDLHAGLSALFPAPGGVRVSPEEQQALRAKFVGTVDTLEDVLEAIDRADRAGRARGLRAREGR
ncbi:hypothetical protein D7V97_39845 [Corallococcus sp. CA053C]|nr:hypothetical protein D7V97_39845 [Corallococcus sp. CA053C]